MSILDEIRWLSEDMQAIEDHGGWVPDSMIRELELLEEEYAAEQENQA